MRSIATVSSLSIETMVFPWESLEAWRAGDHAMLAQSRASNFLKAVLTNKAKARPGTRFFGEAFVSSKLCDGDGWYSSFKWLRSSRWVDGKGLESEFEATFARALHKAFGKERIAALQQHARELFKQHSGELQNKKPVAPDLWLIIDGAHHFIECKLPHDRLAAHQIAGLALIAKHLSGPGRVVTRVIELRNDPADVQAKFERFAR